jgi:hypothetical protein
MSFLARRDWASYEHGCRKDHVEWLRSLSPADALELLEDFHRFASSFETGDAGTKRLEKQRWADKLTRRRRLVEALMRLDRIRSGRRDPKNAG